MILFVSGRTDIIAFYTPWFINRLHAGFVDVRNPFNPKMVSRIHFQNVDAYLFCTKNPLPILPYLKEITKPIVFHTTITPYKKDIEPNVPNKKQVITAVKKISKIIGIENTYVRYDPIFISNNYPLEYHLLAFAKLCSSLKGYIKHIIISFMDNYKNVENNIYEIRAKTITEKEYEIIGRSFSKIARENGMTVSTCNEARDLTEYGFIKKDCISKEYAYKLTGKNYPENRDKKNCHCIPLVDIGDYNNCNHKCKYCYANYNEKSIDKNRKLHDINSSLLIGNVTKNDIVKERIK